MTEHTSACRHGQTGECAACSDERYDELAKLRAERDALQRKYDHAVGAECVGAYVKGEGYVPACRTLRAERDAARARTPAGGLALFASVCITVGHWL